MIILKCWLGEDKTHDLLFENWMVLICKTLSFFTEGCFKPSLVQIGLAVMEKKILNVYLLFVIISPWHRAWPFICLNLNPLNARMLCQVWLKLAHWFLRTWYFVFVNEFSLFRNYLPLEKGLALCLNKLEFPHQRMLCEIGPVILEKKIKYTKVDPEPTCWARTPVWNSFWVCFSEFWFRNTHIL